MRQDEAEPASGLINAWRPIGGAIGLALDLVLAVALLPSRREDQAVVRELAAA